MSVDLAAALASDEGADLDCVTSEAPPLPGDFKVGDVVHFCRRSETVADAGPDEAYKYGDIADGWVYGAKGAVTSGFGMRG